MISIKKLGHHITYADNFDDGRTKSKISLSTHHLTISNKGYKSMRKFPM
ncbi:protein of unknown function [Candidatus Nitrosocosmicus franklandus]|uniref:Uncharacterized protein n=1 Tax=Candidatus Nitrosocosmicus franklandianus TaxID=1798806 RepID=A0A484I4K1_9ARCH|nr:protein of unknown function [Candidatus Nitrosocosmicus franklandus]